MSDETYEVDQQDDLSEYDVGKDAVDNATSRTLARAPEADISYAKGHDGEAGFEVYRWQEVVALRKVQFAKPQKPYRTAESGDTLAEVVIGLQVDPESMWEDGASKNVGKFHTERLRFNITAMSRSREGGQLTMSNMSTAKLVGLLRACGLDREGAKDAAQNPARCAQNILPEYIGEKVTAIIRQSPNLGRNGEPQDEVSRFLPFSDEGYV